MERYTVPLSPSHETPKGHLSSLWHQTTTELNGRFSSSYYHGVSRLLLDSYVEARAFGHHYHMGDECCPTHLARITNAGNQAVQLPLKREGISGLEFDTKGIYLASVTKSGCLTVHDFETLYCMSYGPSESVLEDERKQLIHISTSQHLEVVRWNIMNQDEVACASRQSDKLLIFDIGYISSEPIEVLEKGRSKFSLTGCNIYDGLSDITFSKSDKFRLLASDTRGFVRMWDRRLGSLPCLELTTNLQSPINSIQLDIEDRILFGASEHGVIYTWDLRGGRASFAFQSHNQVHHPLLTSMKIAAMLEKITSLKAQTTILPKEIHSINFNPSCPYQLAFHLDDGWSGVLNTNDLNVTHMHCPPPAWLDGVDSTSSFLDMRKPSWLSLCSIYAAPSHSGNGIHLLDFYPDTRSGCHVEYNYHETTLSKESSRAIHSKFIHLSEPVAVCAAHPLNGAIIAGSKQSSLLLVSQDAGRG
ncbi:unnamed protein product [Spirodela intermedia]|uniref:Uncharacterized protein n=1 Tax=Spirodela intermedia TaxID=51605 RepID=A0A7I8LFA7_SPIIN|nr:unnamed protein product [Spirodela intermedia]